MNNASQTAPLHPPGFASALRGEISLTRRRVVAWVSLGAWALCIAVFAYLVTYLSTVGAEWYTPEQQELIVNSMLPQGTSHYVLASLPLYGAPQFAILGAVIGASDYTRGTLRTLTSRFLSRRPFSAARSTNLLIIAGAAAVVTLLTSVLSSLVVAIAAGGVISFPPPMDLVVALLAIWLIAVTFIAFGFAVGTLVRSIIAAVIIAVAWVLGLESLVIGMLAPAVPVLHNLQGFLPVGATSSLAEALVPDGLQTVPAVTATTSPETAVVVLAAWAVLALAIAAVAFRNRDLV